MEDQTAQRTRRRVLLIGARSFIGRHVSSPLEARGWIVRRAARGAGVRPTSTREDVPLDLDDEATLAPALRGCDAAIYLAPTGAFDDDQARERALRFTDAAVRARVPRVISVGPPSLLAQATRHRRTHGLRTHASVGQRLRESGVSAFELQPSLVVGAGGESWNAVRDLAVRLPLLPEAPWLSAELEPVAADDVAMAVVGALTLPDEVSGGYGVPGPERMSARDLLVRVAALAGRHPRFVATPRLSPPLAVRAIPLLTRADAAAARALIDGLGAVRLSTLPSVWSLLGDVALLPLDIAVRRALNEDHMTLPLHTRALESLLDRVTRWTRTEARLDEQ